MLPLKGVSIPLSLFFVAVMANLYLLRAIPEGYYLCVNNADNWRLGMCWQKRYDITDKALWQYTVI